jgi:hypothetical protein
MAAQPAVHRTWHGRTMVAIVLLGFLVVGCIAASRFRATGP